MKIEKNEKCLTYEGSNYFRQRLILSAISGKSIIIKDIRTKYEDQGLREYEVNLLRLVDKLSNGMVLDVNEIGTELYFQPGILIGGSVEHECCKMRAIGYYLEVIFAFVPYFKQGIQVTLKGVTNNEKDVSVDSFKYSALPLLQKFVIRDDFEFSIRKRGCEPNGGGEMYFSAPTIKRIQPVQLMEYGKIKRIRGTIFSLRVSPSISSRIVEKSKGIFLKFLPDVYLSVDHMHGTKAGKSPGFGGSLVAESTTGVFLTAEATSDPTPGAKTVPEDLAEKLSYLLLEEISRGGCVDSSFQSLACLYMAVRSNDVSQCLFGPLSPYTVQFLRHLRDFFGVKFKLEPYADSEAEHVINRIVATCVGVGYNKLT